MALCCGHAAYAQAASDGSVDDGEIVVTAQKRSETLSTIPIAATAAGQQQLTQRNAVQIEDLAKIVPNMDVFSGSRDGAPQITMRGVGAGSYNPNSENTVVVYFDEFVLNKNSSQGGQMYDLERVEALRGPQGTLYGKNATGGAVNFITRKPDGTTEADAKMTVGRFGELDATVGAQTALSDDWSLRVAANRIKIDGWGKNFLTGKNELGTSIYAGRAILRYKAGTIDAVLKTWIDVMDKAPQASNNIGVDTATGANTPTGANPITGWIDPPGKFNFTLEDFQKVLNKNYGTALNLDVELGDYTLSSVSGYLHFKSRLAQDSDGSPFALANVPNTDSHGHELSQELRIASPDTGPFTWIAGASFFQQKFNLYALYLLTAAGVPPINDFYHEKTTSFAGFADGTFKLGGGVSLFGGVRLTEDKKSMQRNSTTYNFAFGAPFAVAKSKSWTKPTYRAGVNWQANPTTLIYASYNHGYRSGGYDTAFLGSVADLEAFNPEYVDNYETGLKMALFDRRLRFSSAVYYMKFRDMQLFATPPNNPVGATAITNVGKARIYGFETEGSLTVSDNFDIRFEGVYSNTKFTDFHNGPTDYSGATLPYNPKYKIRVQPEVRLPYKDGAFFFSPEVLTVGRQRVSGTPERFNRNIQEAYTDINGQLGYRGEDFSVFAWVRNLTNETHLARYGATVFLGYVQQAFSPPRTFGLTATVAFRP